MCRLVLPGVRTGLGFQEEIVRIAPPNNTRTKRSNLWPLGFTRNDTLSPALGDRGAPCPRTPVPKPPLCLLKRHNAWKSCVPPTGGTR